MTEFQLEILEAVEVRRSPSWLSRLGEAVARFLTKVAFFATMFGLGAAGMAWLPPIPDPPAMKLGDVFNLVVGFCVAIMFFVGLVGLGLTVFTAGQRPRWN